MTRTTQQKANVVAKLLAFPSSSDISHLFSAILAHRSETTACSVFRKENLNYLEVSSPDLVYGGNSL